MPNSWTSIRSAWLGWRAACLLPTAPNGPDVSGICAVRVEILGGGRIHPAAPDKLDVSVIHTAGVGEWWRQRGSLTNCNAKRTSRQHNLYR